MINLHEPKLTEYELKLLQFVPDLTSQERINIGVVAFDRVARQLVFRISSSPKRVYSLWPEVERKPFRNLIRMLINRCESVSKQLQQDQLRIFGDGDLDQIASRIVTPGNSNFLWTPTRYGECENVKARVDSLYTRYVDRRVVQVETTLDGVFSNKVSEDKVWGQITSIQRVKQVIDRCDGPGMVESDADVFEYRAKWTNGVVHLADVVALDHANSWQLRNRVRSWCGVAQEVLRDDKYHTVVVVTDRPTGELVDAYDRAMRMLHNHPSVSRVIPQSKPDEFAAAVEETLMAAD